MIVFGSRVSQARTLRSLLSKDLADRLGWRPARLSKLEQRASAVMGDDEVDALASVLRFPAVFFSHPPVAHTGRALLFRAPVRMSKREQAFLSALVGEVEELIVVAQSKRPFPPVRVRRNPLDRSAAQAAKSARLEFGIERGEPVASMTSALERAGVPVVVRGRSFDDTGAVRDAGSTKELHLGVSTWLGEYSEQPVIIMPALDSWERTRATLAHELGHLVLHRSVFVDHSAEAEAWEFASEFLAPIDSVAAELPAQVTLTALVDVKMRWGLSVGALILHLRRNGVIDEARAKTLQRQIYTRTNPDTGRSWGMTEPGFDSREPERPRLLMRWLEETAGTSSVKGIVAATRFHYPADLVADLLRHQRSRSDRAAAVGGSGVAAPDLAPVVELRPR